MISLLRPFCETDWKNPLFVSESYCTVAVFLFIHAKFINKICFSYKHYYYLGGHILTAYLMKVIPKPYSADWIRYLRFYFYTWYVHELVIESWNTWRCQLLYCLFKITHLCLHLLKVVHQRPLENVFHHLHTRSSLLLEQLEKQPPEPSFWMRINRSYCLMSWDKLSTRRQSM